MSCEQDDATSGELLSTNVTASTPSLCNGNRVDNVWVEGADEQGEGGICLLDTFPEDYVIYVLQRDPVARRDLQQVTTNARLLELAATVMPLPTNRPGDTLQTQMNRNSTSIPFYTQFKGKIPWQG